MLKIHWLEIKYEFLKALRLPAYSLPTLLFPVLFYLFFGVMWGGRSTGAISMSAYLLATYSAFGVIGASLFGFGVSVAIERGQGWLEMKRTTPMPISAYFVSKLAMAMLFSTIITLMLFALGVWIADVELTIAQGAMMLGVLVVGSLPFCALGLALGFLAGPNSAAPIVNLIYLPMGFLSGLWIPIVFLPQRLQELALWLPPYHFGQLALRTIGGANGEPLMLHAGSLIVATLMFLSVGYIGYRRDEGKLYG